MALELVRALEASELFSYCLAIVLQNVKVKLDKIVFEW
jgi:hypothetical protein